jgi:cholesterol oxidase
MRRLAMDKALMKRHYTVVVVGSGYGGGIAASRMARAKQSVCVLERGQELIPGEYPKTSLQALRETQVDLPQEHIGSRTSLYDFRVNRDISVMIGCGLGGTSLVNANVSLRADSRIFLDPVWPEAIRNEASVIANGSEQAPLLAKGYELAEEMLKPNPYPDSFPKLPKLAALEQSAKHMKSKFYRLPINVTFEEKVNHVGVTQHACSLCGDCATGCNHGSKNTVLMNYLPDARNHGAEIFTEVEVRYLSRNPDGTWTINYRLASPGRDKFEAAEGFLTADIVVLAAGTLGSTEILLRSRQKGLKMSRLLGKKFTGNGDLLGFGYNNDVLIEGIGFGAQSEKGRAPVGPCITGVIDLRDNPDVLQGMVIEDGAIPGAIGAAVPQALAAAALSESEVAATVPATGNAGNRLISAMRRELESLMLGPHHGATRNTQTYLLMTHDDGNGEMFLKDDRLRIEWFGVSEQPIFEAANSKLAEATQVLGGKYLRDPMCNRFLNQRLITVHPLGGCPMADDVHHGVVNHKSQVFDPDTESGVHEGLYVCDGAVIPRSLGVNPLLTISALAERSCALIAADRHWTIDYTLPSIAPQPPVEGTIGIEFTEKMTGHFSLHERDEFQRGADLGKTEESGIQFVFTIGTNDLHSLISRPEHTAGISGIVKAPALSPKSLNVSEGSFNLFIKNVDDVETRNMSYRARLTSEEGREFLFEGFKVIRDDGILNIWRDTTTLKITIRDASDPEHPILGKGIMVIEPADLRRQLSTLRVTNAESTDVRLKALAQFGRFFSSTLFQTYGGIFAPQEMLDTIARPREMRALRVSAPRVHFFETPDKVQLRLTRYQGGSKGPVLLSPGLGVSSRIFSLDTIDTNLLEYLFVNGYDVWLLDHRGSIDLPPVALDFSADEVALYDYPAAVETMREVTEASSVQVVAHCYGAVTFVMSMLNGLRGIRSAVCSQLGAHFVTPKNMRTKAGLHLPELLEKLHIRNLAVDVKAEHHWHEKLYSKALQLGALSETCHSDTCRRINFMYGPSFRHTQLNDATHDALHEIFGIAGLKSLDHWGLMARLGHVVDAHGHDKYRPNFKTLSIPICLIHGAANDCYLPLGTQLTYDTLCATNGSDLYSRYLIPGYGHNDCIIGKHAAVDVYPLILGHLERTAI